MKTLARTGGLSHEQFGELHDKLCLNLTNPRISCSELAAVVSRHPLQDPFTLHYQKIGRMAKPDISEEEKVIWGHRLEPVIREAMADDYGIIVSPLNQIIQHDTEEWLIGTPDGKADGLPEGFEAKVVGMGPDLAGWWNDGPPEYVKIQCYGGLAITGWERWNIGVFFAGRLHLEHYVLERDEAIQAWLIKHGREFVANLRAGIAPPTDGSETCAATLAMLYPGGDKDVVALPEEAEEGIASYNAASRAIAGHMVARQRQRNSLVALLENHDAGRVGNWKVWRKPFRVKELEEDE